MVEAVPTATSIYTPTPVAPQLPTPIDKPTSTPTHTSIPTHAPTPTFTPTSSHTPTSTPEPTPTPTNTSTTVSVTIEHPTSGELKCPGNAKCLFEVKGSSSGVLSNPDLRIYVFVDPSGPQGWIKQDPPAAMIDGTWNVIAEVGSDVFPAGTGDVTIVIAVVAHRDSGIWELPVDKDFPDIEALDFIARSEMIWLTVRQTDPGVDDIFPQLAEEGRTFYFPVGEEESFVVQYYNADPANVHSSQYSIRIEFHSPPGIFGGWGIFSTDGFDEDFSRFQDLAFWLKGESGSERFDVKLKDLAGTEVPVQVTASPNWQQVVIPLERLREGGVDLAALENVNVGFNDILGGGIIYIDDFAFTD